MNHPETNIQAETVPKVSFYEKRKKIYAKGIRGYFDNWRIALVVFTQLLFYVSPWLVWNDRQAILETADQACLIQARHEVVNVGEGRLQDLQQIGTVDGDQ